MKYLTILNNTFIKTKILNCSTRCISTVDLSYTIYNDEKNHNVTGRYPLVIMHGLCGSKFNWNSLCKALNRSTNPTRTIISVDARNHGDSPHSAEHSYPAMAEDVAELLKKLKIDKAAVLGHSMGGRAMMFFSLKYPELVEKTIVVDIAPVAGIGKNMTDIPKFLEAMRQVKLSDDLTIHQGRKAVDVQLTQIIPSKPLRDFLITNLMKTNDGKFKWKLNIAALSKNYKKEISNFPFMNDLKFNGPALFVAGGKSDYVKTSDLPVIKHLFPNANLVFIEGAGHWLHSEKPAEFLQLVTNFLNA